MAEMMEQQQAMPQSGQPPVGLINKPEAALPEQGGEKSVADDIPMKADEGDYILPYETVILVGLKDLNRYAREAIKLAMANNVDLGGTDIDPTDDVPIKISNYEYHIPKQLVPFFGGGKKYLDKIREEGLALRKRLEEEGGGKKKEPSAPPTPMPAPPPPQQQAFAGEQAAPEPALPSAPMMQKGGFVLSKDKDAQILEQDKPDTMESKRVQAQQPAMVTPDGKKVQQGFSAPIGYQQGGDVKQGTDRRYFGYNFNVVDDPDYQSGGGGNVEFVHPDEPSNKLRKPSIVIMNREALGQQVGDIDNFLKGEALHYLADVDPHFSGLREEYAKSLTSGQKAVDKRAYDRAKKMYGEKRSFKDWFDRSRLDAHVRGFLYADKDDEWRGSYTEEQLGILRQMKDYLASGETQDNPEEMRSSQPAMRSGGFIK